MLKIAFQTRLDPIILRAASPRVITNDGNQHSAIVGAVTITSEAVTGIGGVKVIWETTLAERSKPHRGKFKDPYEIPVVLYHTEQDLVGQTILPEGSSV